MTTNLLAPNFVPSLELRPSAPVPAIDPLSIRLQQEKRKAEAEKTAREAETGEADLHLWQFVEATNSFAVEDWQRIVCDRLELLTQQEGQRLLIHGPPQFGKSIVISQRFPAYALGKNNLSRVRVACYNQTHAERFSAVNLSIMRSAEYASWFPDPGTRVPNKCKSDEWYTAARALQLDANPSFKALGLASGFTGMGVDILVIDDPYKGAEDADSDAINEKIWDWWTQVVIPRLNPRTNIVVMFHRWREKDFAGRLLDQGGWEYLRFAALGDGDNDPMNRPVGQPLTNRYSAEYLNKVRESQGDIAFAGLYQGKPQADKGNMFKGEMFCPDPEGKTFWPAERLFSQRIVEAYICCDTAAKKGQRNDRTGISLHAMAEDGYVYVAPLVLDKKEVPDVEKEVLLQWAEWRPKLGDILRGMPIEEGASNATAVVQYSNRLKAERRKQEHELEQWVRAGNRREDWQWRIPVGWEVDEWEKILAAPPVILLPFPPQPTRKVVRAKGILSFCRGRHVRIICLDRKEFIAEKWLKELKAFPLGEHDDAVDSTITGVEIFAGLTEFTPVADEEWMNKVVKKPEIVD